MNDRHIDDMLRREAAAPHEVDPAVLARIQDAIGREMHPVRPLPAPWKLAAVLSGLCLSVGILGAAVLGMHGLARLSAVEMALIFPVLLAFIATAAAQSIAEVIPGSPRRISSSLVSVFGSLALVAVFLLLFHDYRTERFVPQGLICLKAGLAHAAIAGAAAWLVLRRGFAVSPPGAGVAAGTLAALAGVSMLELHCPNLEAAHVIVWHVAVVPLSAILGWTYGEIRDLLKPGFAP